MENMAVVLAVVVFSVTTGARCRSGTLSRVLRRMPLGLQLLLLQVTIVLATVVIAGLLAVTLQQRQIRDAYRQQVLTVATSIAQLPTVIDAYSTPDPPATLQPLAELIREASDMTFVVLTDAHGIRYAHPDPARIGELVSTDPTPTLEGEVFVGTETGTLGETLRAKVPIRGPDGNVIGAASVGILESALADDLREDVPVVVGWLGGAALLGSVGSALLARMVRRRIYGLEPDEIARLLEAREAMLHGIREGVLAVDVRGRVVLANDEAVRLLGLDADPTGRPADEVLDPALLPLLTENREVVDEIVLAHERTLLANRTAATVGGRRIADLLTLRDRTELFTALRELDGQRTLTDTLRAQAHEFSNHLHVLQGLIELDRPDEAVRFIDRIGGGGRLLDGAALGEVQDSAVSALLVAKAAVARERHVQLTLDPDSALENGGDDAVTVLGNLIDNAVDAVGDGGHVVVHLQQEDDGGIFVRVDDDGPGVPEADRERVFAAGVTTKTAAGAQGRGIGLALVARIARRRDGEATLARSPLGGTQVIVRLGPVAAASDAADPVVAR
jgi:two-component system, CitB family, sensor kinase